MSTNLDFDIVIIGGGPGGYVGAIRAAQLGFKVAVVEKEQNLGGTCLNVGCIPSKALLDSSEHYHMALHDFETHGIKLEKVELNLPQMMARKEKIVKDLTQGISFLFKKNKIEQLRGWGKIKSQGVVQVITETKTLELHCKQIILATGSQPIELPFLPFDEKRILSSTGALSHSQVPQHLVVIGGGVIGLELGSVWQRLGAKVSVIEFMDKIAGTTDTQISTTLQRSLTKQGIKFYLKSKVTKANIQSDKITLYFEKDGKETTLDCDTVLVAIGRKTFTQNLGLENVGLSLEKNGRLAVNHHFETSVKGIYAIGDLIAGPMLAHKAEEEGVALAEILAGQAGHVNYNTCPGVIYTWPEVATVGLSEEQVKADNIPHKIGTFPFMANGRARALGFTDGMVKIIAHEKTDKILGVHIVGPRASDLIGEAVVAMEFSSSSEDLARSFHAHPTLTEAIREAALGVDGRVRQM